ncbi:MAG: hypothetical protein AAF645_22290 [Myxococcota bacterium]
MIRPSSLFRGLPVAVVLAALTATSAHAQRNVDIERFRPALDADGFIAMPSTVVPGPWQWDVGMATSYSYRPLRGTRDGESFDIVRHRLGADLFFRLGLGGRGSVSIDLPFVLDQRAFADRLDGGSAIASQAMGDPRIGARVRLLGDPAGERSERKDGPGLALAGTLTLPVGGDESFAGEGAATFDLMAVADVRVLGLSAGLTLGWRHRFEERQLGSTVFRDHLLFGVGITSPIPVLDGLGARIEVRGVLDARFGGGPRNGLEGDLAITLTRGGVTYAVGTGTAFRRGVGSPRARAFFSLTWSPRAFDDDADLDGIPDDRDECPHLPEDFDEFEDDDGCMDPDNDNDFIPDVDDQCMNEAPAIDPETDEFIDADEDGCTDR